MVMQIDLPVKRAGDILNPIKENLENMFRREDLGKKDAYCEKHGSFISHGFHSKIDGDEWSACPKCERESIERFEWEQREREQSEQKEREEREKREAESERIRHFNFSHVPLRYQGLDFSSCVSVSESHKSVINRFAAYARQEARDMKNLIIHGDIGTGKTHLLCVLAQTRHDTQYWRFSDIMRRIKDTFAHGAAETESMVLNELSHVGLLIIDEIGRQVGTVFEGVSIFDLIDNRYNNCLPTVLCSNLPVSGNPSITTYISPAAMDRINENSAVVVCNWRNFRSGK
jgi:DNA replication protein DnaC